MWPEKAVNQKHANGAALAHTLASSSSCGFNISGLNCPDWFAKKIWVCNVSLSCLGQIYAIVLRCSSVRLTQAVKGSWE